nr:MAG TPA: hypothetical protein [Caudoviricetes sp.]
MESTGKAVQEQAGQTCRKAGRHPTTSKRS